MRFIKRLSCCFLSLFLLAVFPLTALAIPASVVPTVAEYVFSLMMSSNGVSSSLSSVKSVLGSWTGYDDYERQGKAGKLGSYSQYLYDTQNSASTQELRDLARKNYASLDDLMHMKWSNVGGTAIPLSGGVMNGFVDGIKGSMNDFTVSLKGYLSTFPSYGTPSLDYSKFPVSFPILLGNTKPPIEWIDSFSFAQSVPQDDGWLRIDNYYYARSTDRKGAHAYLESYNQARDEWTIRFRYIVSSGANAGKAFPLSFNVYMYNYNPSTSAVKNAQNTMFGINSMSTSAISGVPIPVFSNKNYADSYVSSGSMDGLYNKMSIAFPVDAVNHEAQKQDLVTVPQVITLPNTGEEAAKLLQQLQEAMGSITELQEALKNAGLAVEWGSVVLPTVAPTETATDSTGESDTEGKITLADVIAKIESIPASLAAILDKKFPSDESVEDPDKMKLPTELSKKFPFCIPFDVAYLVGSMNASAEVPVFELPFSIHYQSFNYDHTFVVDLSEWAPAVKILRTMLDLLFIAGLISVTRDLIRG